MDTTTALSSQYSDIAYDYDDSSIKTYLKLQMFHINRFREELDSITSVVAKENMPEEHIPFLKKLISYERKNAYNYSKSTYKPICGIMIELLLPRKVDTMKKKANLAFSFMKKMNPIGYQIPWIAYEIKKGSAVYLRLLFSEREFLNKAQKKRYNRNYYDKNGVITHKKGDLILDKHGNTISETVLWSNKVRLISFNRKQFKKLIFQLTEKFIESCKKILNKIETRFRIKQKTAKAKWHFYNRACVTEINTTKQHIEFMCNYAVQINSTTAEAPWYEEQRGKSIPIPKKKEITALFHKYKARFEKGYFHDDKDTMRKISYRGVALPLLKENLEILRAEFKQELSALVPTVYKSV